MKSDRFEELERFGPLFDTPQPSYEAFLRRRDRKRRNQRIAAGVLGIAVFVVPVWIIATRGPSDRTQTPGGTGPSVSVFPQPEVDYVVDLNTGDVTLLPDAIIRSLGDTAESGQYAASPVESLLAYVGADDDGTPQIFVSGRSPGESPGPAGTPIRQMTHDPKGATSPAWSPDGTRIAYVGYGPGGARGFFVLDVATGHSTRITMADERANGSSAPQFTPDGASLLYTGGTNERPELRTVPLSGGRSALLIEPGNGLNDAGNGSLSPDGSLITYLGGGSPLSPDGSPLTYHGVEITHAGPGRFMSNIDGTGFRFLPGYLSDPPGTWSPDGTRIVCSGDDGVSGGGIIVVDIATGDYSRVAEGVGAIWLNDHVLLVEV